MPCRYGICTQRLWFFIPISWIHIFKYNSIRQHQKGYNPKTGSKMLLGLRGSCTSSPASKFWSDGIFGISAQTNLCHATKDGRCHKGGILSSILFFLLLCRNDTNAEDNSNDNRKNKQRSRSIKTQVKRNSRSTSPFPTLTRPFVQQFSFDTRKYHLPLSICVCVDFPKAYFFLSPHLNEVVNNQIMFW